jgi:putative ABC transport system permease protein
MGRFTNMDFGARWDKIIHDIWDNKARSLLVVCSLAIGIAAVGMINNAVRMMKRDLFGGYALTNPASINIYVSPFQKELTNSINALRDVEWAEARRTVTAFIRDSRGNRHNLQMIAVPDLNEVQINRITIDEGAGLPALRAILLERDTARKLKLSVGDRLPVEMENGNKYELTISGIVHDMSAEHYGISGEALGYLSMSTLEWMGEEPYYNLIKLVVSEEKNNRDHVLRVAGIARDRVIEPAGYQVLGMSIFNSNGIPGDYWAKQQINGVLLILQIMSVLAILLSGGLVVNTVSAVIVQQTRQIGIMRSVGASRRQIVLLYLGYVFVLSVFGLIIALPLGMIGAGTLSQIAANFMNYQVGPTDLSINLLLIQAGLGLLMPVGVALLPIMRGTRVSVYDAIYQYGLISGENHRGWIEQQLGKIRNIKPPVLLSLRNTFRNKSRLAFTLVTLTIAGATFMAVFSSYSTLLNQIQELGRYIRFDASIDIPGGANRFTAEREAMRIPDIKFAEGWALSSGFIVHPDGAEGDRIEIVGLPENARTIQPHIVTGRWLLPTDTSQVVINEDLLAKESGLRVGEDIEIKINDVKRKMEIVGIASKHMMGSRIYMTENQLAKLTGRYNQVDTIRVLATQNALGNQSEQNQIGKKLEKRFDDARLSQSSSQTRTEIFSAMTNSFNIILFILLLVAIILTVVGGLGLTGTMGLNVLERTREIGVLRAVGASYISVRQVVVVEGIAIAMLSWFMSALISYPFSLILAEALVRTALGTQAVFNYSFPGLFIWMGIVVFIGIFSSLAPARDAARLTVREVLSYE